MKAVLLLGVEDVDLDDRRARTPDGWVTWRSGTARLLPMLIADRTRGPLFLTDRRPGPGRRPRDTDLDPETGRVRLSYERAEYVFKRATTSLDPAGNGWTLVEARSQVTGHVWTCSENSNRHPSVRWRRRTGPDRTWSRTSALRASGDGPAAVTRVQVRKICSPAGTAPGSRPARSLRKVAALMSSRPAGPHLSP